MATVLPAHHSGKNATIDAAGNITEAEYLYFVFGETDEQLALQALAAAVPGSVGSMYFQGGEIEEHIGGDKWKMRANYSTAETSQSQSSGGSAEFSFSTGGGTRHITRSLSTRNQYGPNASLEVAGNINYDGERVNGVDITVPIFNFELTAIYSQGTVNQAFREKLKNLTGTINIAAFAGFNAREVLFMGASGRLSNYTWNISYRFSQSDNLTDIPMGEYLVQAKAGWDYAWTVYEDAVDDAKHINIQIPTATYVEQVYKEADFSQLGLVIPA